MKSLKSRFLLVSVFLSTFVAAQSDSTSRESKRLPGKVEKSESSAEQKGSFYFAFGYNKNWYSTSDVRVHDESGDYDFTLHNLKAKDRPHFNEILRVAISIPQYGYRIGYWMPNGKWGVELKFDHAKYIQVSNQTLRLTGNINGTYYDQDTLVTDKFLQFEHTDGANFLMLNGMYRHCLYDQHHLKIYAVGKFGAGIVIPRSDVILFGQRWNHCFHVAGQIAGGEAGIRTEIFRWFFIEASVKGVYANFNTVLAIDDILISHRFWDGMVMVDAGFQFPMGKAKNWRRKGIAQPTW